MNGFLNRIRLAFGPRQIDPAKLTIAAGEVRKALVAVEEYLAAKGDDRGRKLMRDLHKALEKAWQDHAPGVGGDAEAFSGGVKPE